MLDQIQGAIAYVDTLAPRPEVRRYQELRATLEAAYNRLHQRMHQAGVYHAHPLHDPTHATRALRSSLAKMIVASRRTSRDSRS